MSLVWKARELLAALERAEPKCLTCGKGESEVGELFRCWDCKARFCDTCVRSHFGTQHQPHPMTRHRIRQAMLGLVAIVRGERGKPIDDTAALALFRADEVLQGLPPEKGDPHAPA